MGQVIVAAALLVVIVAFIALGLYLTGHPIPILSGFGIGPR